MWNEIKLEYWNCLTMEWTKLKKEGKENGLSREGNWPGGSVCARCQWMHTLKMHQG